MTQHLIQAVRVQVVEGETWSKKKRWEVWQREHLVCRAESPPTPVAENVGRLEPGERMQHELFDMTAQSAEVADVPPIAAFVSRQEAVQLDWRRSWSTMYAY